jgi:hypothetical protein
VTENNLSQEPPLPTLSSVYASRLTAAVSYEEAGEMGALYAALAKAQGAFPVIETTRMVEYSGRKFWYAELGEVIAKTRPVLSANGLCLLQCVHGLGEKRVLTTKLAHASGASLSLHIELPECETPQKLGSALTYLKRYSLSGLLFVASEDDDDGNVASGTPKQTSPKAAPPPRDKPPETQAKPSAMSSALKRKIFDLSQGAGFNTEELKAFAARHDVNLDSADDAGGKKVLDALEALKVRK